ncbi:MAG: LytTR family DNA-binding domain-containing protein [Desulfobacterales bacterium]|nr:LytTR family DNA-binding domain-containing protein [Desulfobacterales bacterium]
MTNHERLRVVVVEDNPDSMDNLLGCLGAVPGIHVAGTADNGDDGILLINKAQPDLVFLDVEMPGKNGFEVLEALTVSPGIIFVTAYERFAAKAFEVNGIDYIVKPAGQRRVEQAIEKAKKSITLDKADLLSALSGLLSTPSFRKRFTVKQGDQIYIIPKEEVFYFKAEDKYVFLCTRDKAYFYNSTIKDLARELHPEDFCRVNRSHIVAIDKIKKLKKNYKLQTCLVLDDESGTSVTISKTYLSRLKSKLDS